VKTYTPPSRFGLIASQETDDQEELISDSGEDKEDEESDDEETASNASTVDIPSPSTSCKADHPLVVSIISFK
jgi:hypothetical protein